MFQIGQRVKGEGPSIYGGLEFNIIEVRRLEFNIIETFS